MNAIQRFFSSDIAYNFRTSPVAIAAALVLFICLFCAMFAGFVAPHNPFDLALLELSDARLPPAWDAAGKSKYLLGTDDQGRDILSALMYGARISLVVSLTSVCLSVFFGCQFGLVGRVYGRLAGYLTHADVRRDAVVSRHSGGPIDCRCWARDLA